MGVDMVTGLIIIIPNVNRTLDLILVMSAGPIAVATFVGLLVGLFQTVTQLQEQTLPFGV
ncbi:flagellar biosynthetic protein FliQ, partial [Escherichia coli]|uniref:EscS/YscS/HrcS family type III secretion system export apparatus protein n=1 Tax=Escherichia coli TaxID=562 RepID=UPI002889E7C0